MPTAGAHRMKEPFECLLADDDFLSATIELGKYPLTTHRGLLLAITKTSRPDSVLLRYHTDWRQWLFPCIPLPFGLLASPGIVAKMVQNVLGISADDFDVAHIGEEFVTCKLSKRRKCLTEYTFRVAWLRLRRRRSTEKFRRVRFTHRGSRFKWFPSRDMHLDVRLTSGNEDVVAAVQGLFGIATR